MINSELFMADIQTFVRSEINAPNIGDACAIALLKCFALNFRSQQIYVPTQRKRIKEASQRNEKIISEFTGHNQNELAIKYQLSLQFVYKLIARSREKKCPSEKPLKPILLYVIDEHLPADFIKSGLSEDAAKDLSEKLADYICEKYTGTMFNMRKVTMDIYWDK